MTNKNYFPSVKKTVAQFLKWEFYSELFKLVLIVTSIFFYVLMFTPLLLIVCKALFISNASGISITFKGFQDVFFDQELRKAGLHSILLGFSSACVAGILGTISAFTQYWSKNRTQQFCSYIGLTITIILPEIALSIFLLGWLSFLRIPLGFPALLVSHTAFCIPFVAFPLWSQLRFLDREMIESSRDLGAKTSTIFFKIILPPLYSTLAASFLLCFFLSIDDVVISSFFASPNYQTLSLYIYAAGRLGISRNLNALATVLLLISSSFFWVILCRWIDYSLISSRGVIFDSETLSKQNQIFSIISDKNKTKFKKYVTGHLKNKSLIYGAVVCLFSLISFMIFSQNRNISGHKEKNIYLYTWSGFFPKQILDQFSKETGYEIVPSYFSSNEELYAQLDSYPNVSYDLILPSSYFLPHLIFTDKIQPLPKEFQALISRVEEDFLEENTPNKEIYAIPYLWGATGIGINPNTLDRSVCDITSWSHLWNNQLKEKIFAVDDAKEMFYIARLAKNEQQKNLPSIKKEKEFLEQLMPNVQAFAPPDSPHLPFLEQQAELGILWNGSANLLQMQNIPVKFIWPSEGALLWIDNFCLPKQAKNLQGAFEFISFISRPEISAKIVELTNFPSPYKGVKELLSEEFSKNDKLFPSSSILEKSHLLKYDPQSNREEEEEIEFQKLKLGV